MNVPRCNEKGIACFCQLGQRAEDMLDGEDFISTIEKQILLEQLYNFEGVWRALGQPEKSESFIYPFYFHMLDGYRPEAVSLGHNPKNQRPEDAADFEASIQRAVQQCGNSEDLAAILLCAHQNRRQGQNLEIGARAFVTFRGQRLSPTPSRLEQCLYIHSELPNDQKEDVWDGQAGIYIVENYLGRCETLERVYQRAFALGPRQAPQSQSAQISSDVTLPYLAAEHLLLAARHKDDDGVPAFRALQDKKLRPGMVILPFSVLGQNRAAGVWFYRGGYYDAENKALRDHLKRNGPAANRLLPATVSQIVVNSSNMMIFRALGSLPNNSTKTPLKYCRRVQRAFANLWFSPTLVVRNGAEEETIHTNDGAAFVEKRGCDVVKKTLQFATQREVIDLLGFDTMEFKIPFQAREKDDSGSLQEMHTNLSAVILSEHERARKRMRADMRRKMDITAHDYANAINNLVVFADPKSDRGADLPVELRLQAVRRIASHMRGYAWIIREVAKSDAQPDPAPSSLTLSDFSFSRDDPSIEDLETWKNYLYWEALYSAYIARERYFTENPGGSGILELDFSFIRPRTLDPNSRRVRWERPTLVDIGALREGLENGFDKLRPHWPLQATSGRGEKLDDLGRCSIMLWGAIELMRNACEKTAATLSSGQANALKVTVAAAIARHEKGWQIRIGVENDTAQTSPKVESFHWYEPMRQLIPNIKFENASSGGRASYQFILDVGGTYGRS